MDGGVGFSLGSGVPEGFAGGVGISCGLAVSDGCGRGVSLRAQPAAVIKTTTAARETGLKFIASPTEYNVLLRDSLCGGASKPQNA